MVTGVMLYRTPTTQTLGGDTGSEEVGRGEEDQRARGNTLLVSRSRMTEANGDESMTRAVPGTIVPAGECVGPTIVAEETSLCRRMSRGGTQRSLLRLI